MLQKLEILGPKLTDGKNDPYWATPILFQKVKSVTFFWNIINNRTVCKFQKHCLDGRNYFFVIVPKPIAIATIMKTKKNM